MRPIKERILAKINITESGCWLWTGKRDQRGYAEIRMNCKSHRVSRKSYETFVGPIPDGLAIDHLCKVTSCVNPAHLEAVTQRENVLRGLSPSAINAAKTHCLRGHALSGDNLRKYGKGRTCVACVKISKRLLRIARRAAASV